MTGKTKAKALGLVAATLAVSGAWADVDLYSPTRTLADQGIKVTSWGSGLIAESDELAFEGTASIRIASRNFFQGGILNFARPVNLTAESADPANLLMFTLSIPGTSTTMGGGFGPGGPGAGGLDPGGMGPGAMGPGTMGPGGLGGPFGPGGPGGAFGPQGGEGGGAGSSVVQQGPPSVRMIRVILTDTDGAKAEAFLDLTSSLADARGWRKVGIPLAAFSGW
ncbi:MAG: hypothetical protein MH204_03425, partial [Fimbriimonadaceae bacterium]|nr:hypothetical protein [Fimbriimonadaceae bacterium]